MRGNSPCFLLPPTSIILIAIWSCATAIGAAAREVVPVEGAAFAGELVAIDADGRVTFRVPPAVSPAEAGAPSPPPSQTTTRSLQLEELVRWGHPATPQPQMIVVLTDGGQVVTAADWAGGAAVRLEGDQVVVLSDVFDETPLTRSTVRGVVFAQRAHPAERLKLVEQLHEFGGGEDAVFLVNGDRLSGSLTELAGGSLTMATPAGAVKLPLSRVQAVALGNRPPANPGHARLMVGLRDGSLLNVRAVRADEGALKLELEDGVKLAGGSVEDVAALQSPGGPFVYLSDLQPADYHQVPYFDLKWHYQRDRSVMGEPLVVRGKHFLKGLGMHSASRLTYRLDGGYRQFDAAVALDDSADGRGSVTFGVYVLRDGQWQEAYKSGIVRGGDAPRPVSVDVRGARGLTLTVDYADRGDEMDRAVWLDARVLKAGM
jgi:hypothetical protein